MAGDEDPAAAQIRALRPDDDLDAQLELNERSFGVKSPDARDHWRRTVAHLVVQGRCLGAFAGARPVGTAMFHDMRQRWRGRAVPMAGVSSVAVAPEERGQGIARRLMAALLAEMARQGYPISALYPATVRAFWSHVGSHASIAEKVYVRAGAADSFWWLTRERDADVTHRSMWMLRVVDAPGAIAARGFPAATSLCVPLDVSDGACPANSGRWELTVADQKGTLNARPPASAASPPLTLGPRGLAALYAGTPVATVRQVGLASGGSTDGDAALDAAFGATAYMLDSF